MRSRRSPRRWSTPVSRFGSREGALRGAPFYRSDLSRITSPLPPDWRHRWKLSSLLSSAQPEGCRYMVYFTTGELASAGLLSSPRIFPSSSA
jgi:hypothetical protein